ncbi:MAG: bifunctional precorrin-2 dehydrogenase/sirohydrochlorin ferrochelatase [Verrucomicrobia bacterium]|nr:bifunctional precorrin-2 dehydrogenase/sirohydrochlorin ferrochelatase [Verrucomicrobiota bacterium]
MNSSPQKRYYPAFLDVEGLRCVVVGGGNVALRKAHALTVAGAEVSVVAPEVSREMEALVAASPRVRLVRHEFDPNDLAGAYLAIAATNDATVNETVARVARELGMLVNVVDQPALSGFIVPATVSRGRLQVAISTSGASPAFAARLRKRLDDQLDADLAATLEGLAEARALVLAEVADPVRRAAILKRLASDEVVDSCLDAKAQRADTWLMDEARRLIEGAGEAE